MDGFTISDTVLKRDGDWSYHLYVKQRYIGYSVSVAKRLFKAYCKEVKNKGKNN